MMLPAMELDPEPITSWVALLVALGTLTAMVSAVVRWSNKRIEHRIIAVVRESTHPIQSDANGGSSLPDVARMVADLHTRQTHIAADITELSTVNEATHEAIGVKVDMVAQRLDEHAASPSHDRRHPKE